MTRQLSDRDLGRLMLGMFAGWLRTKESPLMMAAQSPEAEQVDENTNTCTVETFSGLKYRLTVEFLPDESRQ